MNVTLHPMMQNRSCLYSRINVSAQKNGNDLPSKAGIITRQQLGLKYGKIKNILIYSLGAQNCRRNRSFLYAGIQHHVDSLRLLDGRGSVRT